MTLWVLEAIFKSIQLYRQTSILRVCVHVRARRGVRVACAVTRVVCARDGERRSQTKACVKAKGLQRSRRVSSQKGCFFWRKWVYLRMNE